MSKMLLESYLERFFCFRNFKTYLNQTSLHGLRFIGDHKLTFFERLFFLCAFMAAFGATTNFIVNVYTAWIAIPVIIGIDPFPTTISTIPFPALTLCNLNQFMRTKVENYSKDSFEGAMLEIGCFMRKNYKTSYIPENYLKNNLSIPDFLVEHTQPCANLLLYCKFNSFEERCTDLFRETLTDEGQCCIFNLLHPTFRFKNDYRLLKDYTSEKGNVPVDWSPENGYQKDLPQNYYPRKGSGPGASVGLTLILNAQQDDFYCSSTNGPGFKMALHSPNDGPLVREIGFTISPGKEAHILINPRIVYATPLIRSLSPASRLCLFPDEGDLVVYKFYTRKNCESECQAFYIYRSCNCIPYNLPFVVKNASVCGAPENYCTDLALKTWLSSNDGPCRETCLPTCFDLTFNANAFSASLIEGNYTITYTNLLKNMSKEFIKKNIAILHFYYRDFLFHGDIRNVYVGFNEFLANTGGILSLFLGFSFISLAEMFYFSFLRPIFWWKRPYSAEGVEVERYNETPHSFWLGHEIYQPKRDRFHNSGSQGNNLKFSNN